MRRVAAGPFEGLELSPASSWAHSPIGAYLVGCYESELHPWLERAIAAGPAVVVDIGAAEGYYAVGLARRLPESHVHAFDLDPAAQQLCRINAELNFLRDRVHVNGRCDHERLRELAGPGHLLVVDCEGCEDVLLDPTAVPELADCWIVVELHEFLDAQTGRRIQQRFTLTHDVELISARETRLDPQPDAFASLTKDEFEVVIDERRPTTPAPMRWALLTPKRLG